MHFFLVRQPEKTWSAGAILCGRPPHFLASQGKRRTLTLQLRWSGKRLITYPGLMRLYLRATEVRSLADLEKHTIMEALRRANGNKSRAAAALGLSRTQLFRRVRRLGLDV